VTDPASPGETRNTVEAAGDKVPAALAATLTETAASDAAKALDEAINVVRLDSTSLSLSNCSVIAKAQAPWQI